MNKPQTLEEIREFISKPENQNPAIAERKKSRQDLDNLIGAYAAIGQEASRLACVLDVLGYDDDAKILKDLSTQTHNLGCAVVQVILDIIDD